MKKFGKFLLISFSVLIGLLAVAIPFTIGWAPFVGPKTRQTTNQQFERTPQRLERGQFLFRSLSGCSDCHSEHDWTARGAPMKTGTEGAGQVIDMPGLPGRVVAPNITPDVETGAGGWTDDQIARAIREGISHDGHAIFPMMPYQIWRNMPDEDVASLVVYLRSLAPVRRRMEPTRIMFPVKYLMRSAPQPVTEPAMRPDPSDRVKYGQYLVTLAACADCHTPQDKGKPIPGMDFAGGFMMKGPWGEAATANLTPDVTGTSYYTEALFLQALHTGYVGARPLNSIMPFGGFKNLPDDDVKAIFAYTRTLKPVKHRVDNSLPPTYCKLCKQTHGAGEQN